MSQAVTRAVGGAVKQFSEIPGPALPSYLGRWLGGRGKTQYHLALGDMFRQYGPLVRENVGGADIGQWRGGGGGNHNQGFLFSQMLDIL